MVLTRVGNPSVFAIDSVISQAYTKPGQRGLGYFVIELGGKSYGIRSPNATLLACSLDAVRRRIAWRGKHRVAFGIEPVASKLVDAFLAATFFQDRQNEIFFGMSADEFREVLSKNEIVWAPDGDAAFDDGSYILQFDLGNSVRLIGFKNGDIQTVNASMAEIWMEESAYYALLDAWQNQFERDWQDALRSPS